MPSPGLRQLTIALTLVVIAAHPACGFTIQRPKPSAEAEQPSTDLALQESIQLQIKNDLKSPNDIKESKSDAVNKATLIKNQHKHKSESHVIDSIEDNTTNNVTDTVSIPHTQALDVTTNIIVVTTENSEESAVTGAAESEYNPANQFIEGNETTLAGSTATAKNVTLGENNTTTEQIINSTEIPIIQNLKDPAVINITVSSVSRKPNEVSATEETIITDQIAIDSEATLNLSARKNLTDHTALDKNESSNVNSTTNRIETSSIGIFVDPITTEINEKQDSETADSSANNSFSASTTSLSIKQEKSSEFTEEDTLKSASTIVEVVGTDASPIDQSSKRYITIERKRGNSSEEATSIQKDKDSITAESNETTIPIPSEEMSEESQLLITNQTSIQIGNDTAETGIMPTLGPIEGTQSETLGTVASKRAGFLNLSKITYAQVESNTASSEKQPNMYRTMYEMEAADIEAQEIKKIKGHESDSQLAEDAMKEELMKEEMLNNHVESIKRHEEGKSDQVKLLADDARIADSSTSQSVSEENLSVQPINQDRRSTLYTVGPNYKPMKRIEVQPAKPFLRDPDDNSWRNESISSLGIVFNPKNSSSKSFKEVLKTKSETEFNNLQDRDNKGGTPELRARLEKITEVRKSKKKRIDKFGEVVYTDYEDGSSAEGASTARAEAASPGTNSEPSTPSSEPEPEVTSPMTTTTEGPRYWKNKLEVISKQEMLKDLGLDILTTDKPKKAYNIAEYYDTTDEYDADYVTLLKMDLKKFTQPAKGSYAPLTSPPMPHTNRLTTPRFPDRRPTVQYFPPTNKPQKVNVNDYDVDFERRVRLYTLKEVPSTAPPPRAVATDQPRPTPHSHFTLFTPDDGLTEQVFATEQADAEPPNFVVDGHLDRGSYVIKHYGDFLNQAAKDEDRDSELVPFTRGGEIPGGGRTTEPDYEYDSQFRKKVLSRFVDNFNRNSERFKEEFPVLFNSSVVHRPGGEGVASSTTFVKRLYDGVAGGRGCPPRCDVTVELSPAYELHYYVPEQEEREMAAPPAPAARERVAL